MTIDIINSAADATMAPDEREAFDKFSDDTKQRLLNQILKRAANRATPADHSNLTVWYGSMPESNGKTNWTAILHRGDVSEGFTIDRSEYPDRVLYEADRVRWLIGEIDKEPWITDYDADKHSGYVTPADHSVPVALTDSQCEQIAHIVVMNRMGGESPREWVILGIKAALENIAAPQPPQKDADHIEAQSVRDDASYEKHDVVKDLRTFLNAAGGEGFVLDGIDGGGLYMSIFSFEDKVDHRFALAALAASDAQSVRDAWIHTCGLPMSVNPHPEAGVPGRYLETGCQRECIPCLVLSRHQWSKRAVNAEKELRDLKSAPPQKPEDAS